MIAPRRGSQKAAAARRRHRRYSTYYIQKPLPTPAHIKMGVGSPPCSFRVYIYDINIERERERERIETMIQSTFFFPIFLEHSAKRRTVGPNMERLFFFICHQFFPFFFLVFIQTLRGLLLCFINNHFDVIDIQHIRRPSFCCVYMPDVLPHRECPI